MYSLWGGSSLIALNRLYDRLSSGDCPVITTGLKSPGKSGLSLFLSTIGVLQFIEAINWWHFKQNVYLPNSFSVSIWNFLRSAFNAPVRFKNGSYKTLLNYSKMSVIFSKNWISFSCLPLVTYPKGSLHVESRGGSDALGLLKLKLVSAPCFTLAVPHWFLQGFWFFLFICSIYPVAQLELDLNNMSPVIL